MEFYIFRHGETVGKGKFTGRTDSELTPKGVEQNRQTFLRLKELGVDRIFSSDLRRTFVPGCIKTKDIREIDFGKWERLSWEDVERLFPKEAQEYLENPLGFQFPEGESFVAVQARVLGWLDKLKTKPYKKVGLITHQGVMRLLAHDFKKENFWSVGFDYGADIRIAI